MSRIRRAARALRELGPGGWLSAAWLAVVGTAALVAPWLPFRRTQDLRNIRAAPSWSHLLGTDSRGVDMIVRVLDGARVSLLVGFSAGLLGLVVGAPIGLFAGYLRGRVDRLTVVGLDVFAAFPGIVAASAGSLVWGQSLRTLILVLGLLTAPIFARITRAAVLPLAERDFVLAARVVGSRHSRVAWRELVPNILVPIAGYGLLAVGVLIGVEGALSFFGAGVPERYTSWGKLIAAGQERIDTAPHLSLVPAGAITITVLALNALSERWQRHWLFGTARLPKVSTGPLVGRPTRQLVADQLAGRGPRTGLMVRELSTTLVTPFGSAAIVRGVDLDLEPGRLTALVGESGSGKTMLAKSLIGLLPAPLDPSSTGSITFLDHDLRTLDAASLRRVRGRRLAMVFQDPMTSLDPVQRVGRQIVEPMRLHLGLSRQEATARAADLLAAVGVADPTRRLRAYPHELSGGLRQRVAIAVALAADPDVLIADEPTSALDVTIQAQLLDLLDSLRSERRLAVLLITHDLGLVASRADEVSVMYGGAIAEQGPTAEVFASPQHPYTQALLGAMPRLDAPAHHRLTAIPGAPPSPFAPAAGCPYAPRCPLADDVCRAAVPELREAAGHLVACVHPGPRPD